MTKVQEIVKKAIGVLTIFTILFLSNIWLKSQYIIRAFDTTNLEPCVRPMYNSGMHLTCNPGTFVVGSGSMYLSASLFVFLSLLLFKANRQYLYLTPIFILAWMGLSEFVVKLFSIPVIHVVPMEGDVRILDGLYFQFINGDELVILFIVFSSIIASFIAYGVSGWIRESITKSHNSSL